MTSVGGVAWRVNSQAEQPSIRRASVVEPLRLIGTDTCQIVAPDA